MNPRRGTAFRLVALSALMLGLTACSSLDKAKEPPLCPKVSILSDAVKMTRFRPGQGRDLTDMQLAAELTSYHGSCQYDPDTKQMNVKLKIGINAELGPAAAGRKTDISYFVALPAFYPQPNAKEVLSVPLVFPENMDHVRYTDDDVAISFPVPDLKELEKYSVIIGLQLTADELDYNRRQSGRQ